AFSASVKLPMPPFANTAGGIGCESSAACNNKPKLVPADHGPANEPEMPRAETVARNTSVSNHSATRSATAIGPHRNKRYSSFFPRPRNANPILPNCHASLAVGGSMEGGVIERIGASTLPIFEKLETNSG